MRQPWLPAVRRNPRCCLGKGRVVHCLLPSSNSCSFSSADPSSRSGTLGLYTWMGLIGLRLLSNIGLAHQQNLMSENSVLSKFWRSCHFYFLVTDFLVQNTYCSFLWNTFLLTFFDGHWRYWWQIIGSVRWLSRENIVMFLVQIRPSDSTGFNCSNLSKRHHNTFLKLFVSLCTKRNRQAEERTEEVRGPSNWDHLHSGCVRRVSENNQGSSIEKRQRMILWELEMFARCLLTFLDVRACEDLFSLRREFILASCRQALFELWFFVFEIAAAFDGFDCNNLWNLLVIDA